MPKSLKLDKNGTILPFLSNLAIFGSIVPFSRRISYNDVKI